jgi:penicillin-binding protein 1C
MNATSAPNTPKTSGWRWFWRITLGLLSSGVLVLVILLAILLIQAPPSPSYQEVRQAYHPSDAVLLDRHGEILHRLRINFNVRQGTWTALADVSPALQQALLVSEDKNFYTHGGIDWLAAMAAAWNNLSGSQTRGASTITMQLTGLWHPELSSSGNRTLWQKLQQAVAAKALERHWQKDQILEAYLNMVPFRSELVGISAMSEGLFGKAPNGLNARESAIAAALVRAPNASEATVARRACAILHAMQADNAEQECTTLPDFIRVRFNLPRQAPSEGIAPHLAQRLLSAAAASSNDIVTIRTTLDAQAQRIALNSLRQHLLEISDQNVEDGAVIVIDNTSGEVLVWVGSSGADISQAAEIDAITAMRQPGSTLKPFLYAQAIEQRRLTAASLLDDSPVNLNVGSGLYVPQNYDKSFKGWVSVRTALASSLNIPAVRTLVMIGPDAFSRTLLALGLPLKESGDYYGYSLALGSAEVTLLTLTNAFRALPNGGQVTAVRWLPLSSASSLDTAPEHTSYTSHASDQTPASPNANPPANPPTIPLYALDLPTHSSGIGPQSAWIIGSILSDREARAPTFGLDSELNTRYWSAVKTGTSKDMRDNWAIGYSRRYTVGVWVGNASGAAMWGVSGTSGAAPVWRDVMNFLYQRDLDNGHGADWAAPPAPDGIVSRQIHYEPPLEPTRTEWFIAGTERDVIKTSALVSPATHALDPDAPARITSPVSGTIMALDPDIPPANQRLWLRSNHPDVRWQIGDIVIAEGANAAWLPVPGHHRITLVNRHSGQELDSIQLEVRGASLNPTPP